MAVNTICIRILQDLGHVGGIDKVHEDWRAKIGPEVHRVLHRGNARATTIRQGSGIDVPDMVMPFQGFAAVILAEVVSDRHGSCAF